MGRVPRGQQRPAGVYFHVMDRGHNREVVFPGDEDRAYFLGLLDRYRRRFAVRLFHYCLMSNPVHLLVRCEDPRGLSPWMAGLSRAYVHYHHRRTGFVGHLRQGRFNNPCVAVEEYFLSCARSIERNPTTAGLVQEPWHYRWSSCPAYRTGARGPAAVVQRVIPGAGLGSRGASVALARVPPGR